MSARFAENDGVRIAYETRGEGADLLLVQGLGYDRFGWGPAADELARDFRVTVFDNRGVGESDRPPGPYTAEAMAADTVAVLDAAGIDRAHVVGASLGGIVAQQLALTHPQRIAKLVLACTSPGGNGSYAMPARTVDLFMRFPNMPPDEALLEGVRNALSDENAASRHDLVERVYQYRLAHPPPIDGWQAQAMAGYTFDVIDRLGEISTPTLVLTGDADNVVDHRNSEVLAERIPNARLERFPGSGHLFFWEEPGAFVRSVREFLQEPA